MAQGPGEANHATEIIGASDEDITVPRQGHDSDAGADGHHGETG